MPFTLTNDMKQYEMFCKYHWFGGECVKYLLVNNWSEVGENNCSGSRYDAHILFYDLVSNCSNNIIIKTACPT